MPPKMASNSELSEIKLLLQSLASGLKAVKSDLAEVKKSQAQSQNSMSTCTKCADSGPKLSSVEVALSDTETKLLANIRDTESAVLQLVEEEKVLIHAEVVQLSRTVGTALEDAKAKMMNKVAEVVDGNGRKRSRSTAGLDGDDDDDVGEKRIKQEEKSNPDQSDVDNDSWLAPRRRKFTSHFDRAVMDIMDKTYKTFDFDEPEWLLKALFQFYEYADDSRIGFWDVFQKEGKIGFEYCLYGLFYHGHEHPGVASGECYCRVKVTPSIRQEATKCIRVERSEDGSGALTFWWGENIGAPIKIVPSRRALERINS